MSNFNAFSNPRQRPSICYNCSSVIYPSVRTYPRAWNGPVSVHVHADILVCYKCNEINGAYTDVRSLTMLACYVGLLNGVWDKRWLNMLISSTSLYATQVARLAGIDVHALERARIYDDHMLNVRCQKAFLTYMEKELRGKVCRLS